MPKLENIHDLGTLRQAALLLEKTVIDQQKTIAKLRAQIARMEGNAHVQLELDLLKEQLEKLKHTVFGESSEKRPADREPKEPEPRRGHGPKSQPRLPVATVLHTLPETECVCPACGGNLHAMGEQCEESEEVTVVQASYQVVTHKRQKYACRCNGAVVTAPGPAKLIPGGRYSLDFAVHVAEAKYLDHMPLERQVRTMRRRGLDVDAQTLFDQIFALYRHLEPTYQAICRRVQGAEVAFMDETHWRMMNADGSHRWWTWCLASEDAVAYWFSPHRSAEAADGFLKGFTGVLMSDGYKVYGALARAGPPFRSVNCWAHVRRKFIEAEPSFPGEAGRAIELIGRLYEVERQVPLESSAAARADALALRARLRAQQSQPVIDELREWAYATKPTVLPKSGIAAAIDYMLSLWPGLTVFLADPRVPLDNNAAERALRGVVVGRKNHYGSRSKRGAEVAALFYTLFETAKLADVDPAGYVLEATRRAIAVPGTVTLPGALQQAAPGDPAEPNRT